jgi:hypothetical protein
MAYAHLFCVAPEPGVFTHLTVSFVVTKEPKEVKDYLRRTFNYTLTETGAGITIIEGGMLPIQIIERRKLSAKEDLWLANLDKNLSFESMKAVIDEARKVPKGAPINAYLYMLVMANAIRAREVKRMSDLAIFEEVFAGTGLFERVRDQGEEKKALEMARIMKGNNEPPNKIMLYTGLSEQQIAAL